MENNVLLGMRCYQSGPIDRCPNGGKHWRDKITPLLKDMGVVVLDPLNKPFDTGLEEDDYREERMIWKSNGEFDRFSKVMKVVRSVDLRMVDISDFMVAHIDMDIFSCGTLEEIFLANRQKKPIIVFCPQGKKQLPDWLFGTLPHDLFFQTLEEVIDYLSKVDKKLDQRTFGRWLFPKVY